MNVSPHLLHNSLTLAALRGQLCVAVGGCCCVFGGRKQLHLTTESKAPSIIQSVPFYPKECCRALTLGPSNAFVIFLFLTCRSYCYKNFYLIHPEEELPLTEPTRCLLSWILCPESFKAREAPKFISI